MGSLSYTPCPGICLVVRQEESFSYPPRAAVCLVVKRVGSFSYTPRVGICVVVRRVGNLSYTPRTNVSCLRFVLVSVAHRVIELVGSFSGWGGGGLS